MIQASHPEQRVAGQRIRSEVQAGVAFTEFIAGPRIAFPPPSAPCLAGRGVLRSKT